MSTADGNDFRNPHAASGILSSLALIATITVLADMMIAPTAGGRMVARVRTAGPRQDRKRNARQHSPRSIRDTARVAESLQPT